MNKTNPNIQQPIILCLIGPSGSGKTTVGKLLEEMYGFLPLISHTTRPRRMGEEDGRDYYFVDESTFKQTDMIESDNYSGNLYGTSRIEIESKMTMSNRIYAVVTYEGYLALKEKVKNARVISVYIFVEGDTFVQRMYIRGDSEKNIRSRISNYHTRDELYFDKEYDYMLDNSQSLEQTKEKMRDYLKHIL